RLLRRASSIPTTTHLISLRLALLHRNLHHRVSSHSPNPPPLLPNPLSVPLQFVVVFTSLGVVAVDSGG
ncbi:hypothetical protein Drorol1_Dr00018358, partial [Drosera rotundifolia]